MKKKGFTFWFAVYIDYSKNIRIAQIANPIDSLSCEILAMPGAIRHYAANYTEAYDIGKQFAKLHGCSKLEINLDDYTYKFISVKYGKLSA